MHENPKMLTQCLLFYARTMVQSVAMSWHPLVLVDKETSPHVSHEIWCNLYEFYEYQLSCYTICDWICEKGSYMRNYNYLEIQFNSKHLQNDQSCLHVLLHKSIAIQDNSLCLLYTGQLAELPTILDSFLLAQPIPLALLQGRRMGGRQIAMK